MFNPENFQRRRCVDYRHKVQQEIERFFSDLYKGDILSLYENMLNPFLENPDVLKLSQVDAQVCDGKRTVSQR